MMDRRSFLRAGGAALAAGAWGSPRMAGAFVRRVRPVPTPAQLAWQRDELALFIHFGMNTFTDAEWGDGGEDPSLFAPTALDARQWARAARAGGFRSMVLTAKHHDGFCLWPTSTTRHSVVSSPWRGGGGDMVGEFVAACRAEGLRPGLYLSPWDRNNPLYGDSPRYNDLYCEQLTELLTRYGELAEVWFDGANGEGPNGKRQQYDWPRVFGLVRRLQPEAVVFSDAGPDVRWCGNERGLAGDPNWSTVDPAVVPYPGASGPGITDALQHGDPDGPVWRPAETDVSIRPGWFYHRREDGRVRSVDDLEGLYLTSVGRNSKLLLNVPPTPAGLLHDVDVARLAGLGSRIQALQDREALPTGPPEVVSDGEGNMALIFRFDRPVLLDTVRLEEAIERGQVIARHTLYDRRSDGSVRTLAEGTTVGYARIHRFALNRTGEVVIRLTGHGELTEPPLVRFYEVLEEE